jgi:hypothetical protein
VEPFLAPHLDELRSQRGAFVEDVLAEAGNRPPVSVGVIGEMRDGTKKMMLERLYLEYQDLCAWCRKVANVLRYKIQEGIRSHTPDTRS